jgi:RHS repeat-associated protein
MFFQRTHHIARSLTSYTPGSGFASRTATAPYDAAYDYDPNGNLLTLNRRDDQGTMASDFTYNYYSGTNKLQNLNGGADYQYDEIGNLVADPSQDVTSIDWTPYGKVRQVTKGDGTVVNFKYDASGNRIAKSTTTGGTTTTTRYIRDASGNVMAMYEEDALKSQPIYGSSRLGMYKGGNIAGERNLGNKHYELTNHLGNVLAVVTDNINMADDLTTATVVSASDYYPFGLEMAGRTFSALNYAYGFNGKRKDDNGEFGNTHYDYGFRIYNPEIGKFLSVDPLTSSYPWYTPYQFAGNDPILFIDLDGLEPTINPESPDYLAPRGGIHFTYSDVGGGLGLDSYGLAYINQSGSATDKVGKTKFVIRSFFNLKGKGNEKYFGGEINIGIGYKYDNRESFLHAVRQSVLTHSPSETVKDIRDIKTKYKFSFGIGLSGSNNSIAGFVGYSVGLSTSSLYDEVVNLLLFNGQGIESIE